jgi:hypothetical protein
MLSVPTVRIVGAERLQKDDLERLLSRAYTAEQPEAGADRAMEIHLRLLLEQAEDALDRERSARENTKRQLRLE